MDGRIVGWVIGIIIIIALAVGGYFLYKKKKQYDFLMKLVKKQRAADQEAARIAEQERLFAEKQAVRSQTDAENIVLHLGGITNIEKIEQCAIRLRVFVTDIKKVNQSALKKAGVSGIVKTPRNIQLIVGDRAEQIAHEINVLLTDGDAV